MLLPPGSLSPSAPSLNARAGSLSSLPGAGGGWRAARRGREPRAGGDERALGQAGELPPRARPGTRRRGQASSHSAARRRRGLASCRRRRAWPSAGAARARRATACALRTARAGACRTRARGGQARARRRRTAAAAWFFRFFFVCDCDVESICDVNQINLICCELISLLWIRSCTFLLSTRS